MKLGLGCAGLLGGKKRRKERRPPRRLSAASSTSTSGVKGVVGKPPVAAKPASSKVRAFVHACKVLLRMDLLSG
jgi:hypothetical protein